MSWNDSPTGGGGKPEDSLDASLPMNPLPLPESDLHIERPPPLLFQEIVGYAETYIALFAVILQHVMIGCR